MIFSLQQFLARIWHISWRKLEQTTVNQTLMCIDKICTARVQKKNPHDLDSTQVCTFATELLDKEIGNGRNN